MWPLTNYQPLKSAALNDKVRRYRSHLATLSPDRLKLFQTEECTKGPVADDLVQTTKQFAQEVVADNPHVQAVRPCIGKHFLSISIILRPGIDPEACRLPEFYHGYMVDITPRPILPGNRELSVQPASGADGGGRTLW